MSEISVPPATPPRTFAGPMSALDARFAAQKLAFGPVVFQCVRIARKWGVLAQIDGRDDGCTLAELAAASGRSEYALSVLLETCLSAGVADSDSRPNARIVLAAPRQTASQLAPSPRCSSRKMP